MRQSHLALQPPTVSVPQTWTPDDIYDNASEATIRRFAEDQRVERKPARFDPRQLGDYFSIFANRSPHGGVLFVGVSDDGEIEGCAQLDQKRLDELEQAGRTFCPDARYEVKKIPVYTVRGQTDFVLAFRIAYRPDKLVETTRGDAYTRIGSTKKKLSEVEKREIRIGKREISFESEDVPIEWPDAFDMGLIDAYANSYATRRNLAGSQTVEKILVLSHLGRMCPSGFMPNVACTLLFAKDPRQLFPGARIRFLRFDGIRELTGSERNEVADFWIEGPIPHVITEADRVISEQLQGPTRLDSSGRFTRSSTYPKDAWREAIVNACVHRSYNLRNMPTFVRLFDDRLVIESPGGFPPPTTARTVYEGHNPRNPFVMEALFYLDFVKCAQEGARRMRDLMVDAGLPEPEFSEVDLDGYLVRVTLRNNGASAPKAVSPVKGTPAQLKREQLVLAHIGKNKSVNLTEAAELLSVHRRTAKKALDGLVSKGFCERRSASNKPSDPTARYFEKAR